MSETHHWHNPTQGQVIKAMYQYLADQGIGKEAIAEIVEKKVEEVVSSKVVQLLNSGRCDQLIAAAVANVASQERQGYESTAYGFTNRIRNLVNEKIKEIILSDFKVTVEKVK